MRPINSGLMPSPELAGSTGGTGTGAGGPAWAGTGATSTCGSTQPPAGCTAAAAAATVAPHTEAAAAPPLITLRTAHGLACVAAGADAAIAPVEPKRSDPAINAPIARLRLPAMAFLLAQRVGSPQKVEALTPNRNCIPPG